MTAGKKGSRLIECTAKRQMLPAPPPDAVAMAELAALRICTHVERHGSVQTHCLPHPGQQMLCSRATSGRLHLSQAGIEVPAHSWDVARLICAVRRDFGSASRCMTVH